MRIFAIVLVMAGSCAFCVALLAACWAAWVWLTGAGWPDVLPGWSWIAAMSAGGVMLALAGREIMKSIENR